MGEHIRQVVTAAGEDWGEERVEMTWVFKFSQKRQSLGGHLELFKRFFSFVVIRKGFSCVSTSINKIKNKLQVTLCQAYFKVLLSLRTINIPWEILAKLYQ